MSIAVFAVVVNLALYIVLRQCVIALEVEVAVIASPLRIGFLLARTHDVARLVQFGVEVLLEALLILETPLAFGAIVVHLVVMFLKFRIAVK